MLKKLVATMACCLTPFGMQTQAGGISAEKIEEYRKREMAYQRIAYKRLGAEVAKRHAGAKILLIKYRPIKEDDGKPDTFDAEIFKAFKKGLDGKATIAVIETVSSGAEDFMEDGEEERSPEEILKDMLTAKKMDKLIATNKNCSVVVSFAGLPQDFKLMNLWKVKDPKDRPSLVLANAWLYELMRTFHPKYKFITAALVDKPVPFDPNQPVPKDEQKAFDKRFIMVTPDNVTQVHRTYPKMFKENRKK